MENKIRVLCYGDSNTWGYNASTKLRFPPEIRWTGLLAEKLGDRYVIIEEGQNGRTTVWDDPVEGEKNGLRYLEPCLESQKQLDFVALMLGSNDLKAKFSVTAWDIALSVERLIKTIQNSESGSSSGKPGILVICPPIKDPQNELKEMFTGGREKSFHLPTHYLTIAERNGCLFLNSNEHVELDMADGVHLSVAGHRGLADAVAEKIQTYFD